MSLKQGAQYQWEETTTFEISSKQFGIIADALNLIVGQPDFQEKLAEARKTISISNAHVQINEILEKALDEGKAIEVVSQVPTI